MAGISRETMSHIINELKEEKNIFKTVNGWLVKTYNECNTYT